MLVRFEDEFDNVVAALSTLKSAACKARDDSRPQRGRPRGAVLSPDFIDVLVDIHQESTLLKLDKLTEEQFVKFVREFLAAIGRDRRVSQEYAAEAIKYALKLKRKKDHQVRE